MRTVAQWKTSSRLLHLGEAIEFDLRVPSGVPAGDLVIFPRYLERADPGERFAAGGSLDWLDELSSEQITLSFEDGAASATYTPGEPGSYLARWEAGDEVLWRYFSVIDDDWIVLRFSTFLGLEAEPELHGTGIPLDYRLSAEEFDPDNPRFRKFLRFHRHFGDAIVPILPEMPETSREDRLCRYGELLGQVRSAMPFPEDVRSARIEMQCDRDPGYTGTLAELGITDFCGLAAANGKPWLGMPEFPYFCSPVDCRKANQEEGGSVFGHQWDFAGGWHFLGPVSWHYKAAEGDWSLTEKCLRGGLDEFKNLIEFSGHPAFSLPLYDGVVLPIYPNPHFKCILDPSDPACGNDDGRAMPNFVERYQRFMAFEVPKEYQVVYARSIDLADYYRRHFRVTPRTVYVSQTDHIMYDMWWLNHWCSDRLLVPRERIPWLTSTATLMERRRAVRYFKDPLSYEYLVVEDQSRSIRFERECPNPIWWFDYTQQERGPEGSAITHVETPDVVVIRSDWTHTGQGLSLTLKMETEATFADYAIALWDLPPEFRGDVSRIQANAKECIVARNREGAHHLVLVFDLEPDLELRVTIRP